MSSILSPLPAPVADAEPAEAAEPQGCLGIEATMHPAPQLFPSQAQSLPMSRPDQDSTAFDRWLKRELSRLFDPVLNEPVPENLRRLLEAAARGESGRH